MQFFHNLAPHLTWIWNFPPFMSSVTEAGRQVYDGMTHVMSYEINILGPPSSSLISKLTLWLQSFAKQDMAIKNT